MQTLRVDLILAAIVVVVFLVALRGAKIGWRKGSLTGANSAMGPLAKFSDLFWGWADFKPKDWSNAPYKRGYR
jgi:hypothetical protein